MNNKDSKSSKLCSENSMQTVTATLGNFFFIRSYLQIEMKKIFLILFLRILFLYFNFTILNKFKYNFSLIFFCYFSFFCLQQIVSVVLVLQTFIIFLLINVTIMKKIVSPLLCFLCGDASNLRYWKFTQNLLFSTFLHE